jgi:hypothetical protein
MAALLRAKDIYWGINRAEIEAELVKPVDKRSKSIMAMHLLDRALQLPPEEWSEETKLFMIRELDRRLVQLWDKVAFERERGLVDYTKLDSIK